MADQGVVIGINTYPGLQDLGGPCSDALAFKDWLLRPDGGALDPAYVETLLTTDYPPPTNVGNAHPILTELEALFRPLVIKAARYAHTDGRLFIFLAGHGFADAQDINSAALFTADAEFLFPTHLAVIEYAQFFCRTWAFDEVILIMDACRSTNPLHQISRPPLPLMNPHPNASKVKLFLGYGAGFNQAARERAVASGGIRGIFTLALLDALHNARPNRRGRVTGSAVKRHIHQVISSFAAGAPIVPPEIDADETKDVFFCKRDVSQVDVHFDVAAAHLNRELVIAFGGVNEVHRALVAATPVTVRLSPGLYKARIEDTTTSTNFEVPTDVNVAL